MTFCWLSSTWKEFGICGCIGWCTVLLLLRWSSWEDEDTDSDLDLTFSRAFSNPRAKSFCSWVTSSGLFSVKFLPEIGCWAREGVGVDRVCPCLASILSISGVSILNLSASVESKGTPVHDSLKWNFVDLAVEPKSNVRSGFFPPPEDMLPKTSILEVTMSTRDVVLTTKWKWTSFLEVYNVSCFPSAPQDDCWWQRSSVNDWKNKSVYKTVNPTASSLGNVVRLPRKRERERERQQRRRSSSWLKSMKSSLRMTHRCCDVIVSERVDERWSAVSH